MLTQQDYTEIAAALRATMERQLSTGPAAQRIARACALQAEWRDDDDSVYALKADDLTRTVTDVVATQTYAVDELIHQHVTRAMRALADELDAKCVALDEQYRNSAEPMPRGVRVQLVTLDDVANGIRARYMTPEEIEEMEQSERSPR